ncbi:recombinase family protein [Sphingopyxis sp. J-6]|uniref:recombinase family protein n=1 Tax=Sphingopyxis sp. J-6 TaxID=3122054 RepID=UPI003984541C
MKPQSSRRRCAIYTRKSTEEGLDQNFNSLDAQREACGAYILSQTHEGWEPTGELYDDGGYSGGSMERPGLRQLLEDVEAGMIDIIVVYKVDRLTRSLSDFARIVDVLDKHGASFVSVTQAFNTTNSMGRLTLNVLLSFAQFEREVTGERIRDKIAASKARGMWMGGTVPLGYEVKDRKLLIVPAEAEKVRHIFNRYLALRSVYALQAELAADGILTKSRMLKDGSNYGDKNFSRGALYQMLRNRIYRGEITHCGKSYPGEHHEIIDADTFDRISARLDGNRVEHRHAAYAEHPSLFAGIIWDGDGRRLTPNHANKAGVRYRYYISRKDKQRLELPIVRVPAGDIENLLIHQLRNHADVSWDGPRPTRELILATMRKITVHPDRVEIEYIDREEPVAIPATLVRCSGEKRIAAAPENYAHPRHDPALIKLIVRAHQAGKAIAASTNSTVEAAATSMAVSTPYFCSLLRLAHLAPDITAAILDGRQPAHLNRQFLARINNLPIDWQGQREMLGFA